MSVYSWWTHFGWDHHIWELALFQVFLVWSPWPAPTHQLECQTCKQTLLYIWPQQRPYRLFKLSHEHGFQVPIQSWWPVKGSVGSRHIWAQSCLCFLQGKIFPSVSLSPHLPARLGSNSPGCCKDSLMLVTLQTCGAKWNSMLRLVVFMQFTSFLLYWLVKCLLYVYSHLKFNKTD